MKMRVKKAFVLVLAMAVCFSVAVSAADGGIMPLWLTFDSCGGEINYDAETRTITCVAGVFSYEGVDQIDWTMTLQRLVSGYYREVRSWSGTVYNAEPDCMIERDCAIGGMTGYTYRLLITVGVTNDGVYDHHEMPPIDRFI